MQISLNWLSELVDCGTLTPAEVARHLMDVGLEVEAMTTTAPFPDSVVVARILEARKHPNADSLQVCKVDVGGGKPPLDIVCGAPNARAGLTVACAMVGTDLGEGFKIKATKIRGEPSEGMLCSGKELHISDDTDGIMELDSTWVLGTPVVKCMGLADTAMTLNVTPNRPDCLGHIGVARDLAARLKTTVKHPRGYKPLEFGSSTKHIKVEIDDREGCFRFLALYIKNVAAVPSPPWLQKRLTTCGMRPINLIVDVTNAVMLEYGQPIHAYDERDLDGATLRVRAAIEGEIITTLDNQKRTLVAGDLLITDAKKPVGIAGIMGGLNSEVKADTKNIVVEVAFFDPIRIRQTGKRLGIHSEASYRFERGVDQGALEDVASRVAELLRLCAEQLRASGVSVPAPEVCAPAVDLVTSPIPDKKIALRLSRCRKLLGMGHLAADEITTRLKGLEFELIDKAEDRLLFDIPSWRAEVTREVDLIEEVGRIIGYDKVVYDMPRMKITPTPEDPFIEFSEHMRLNMASLGCVEVITFPFVKPSDYQKMRVMAPHPLASAVELRNPLADDDRLMRTTMIPGLINSVTRNRNHLAEGVRLFECGRGYFDMKGAETAPGLIYKDVGRHPRHLTERGRTDKRLLERHWLGFALDQPFAEKSWDGQAANATFYSAKALLSEVLGRFGITGWQVQPIEGDEVPFLHPGASARIVLGGSAVGFVGELHPEVADAFGFDPSSAPVVGEVDLEKIYAFLNGIKISTTTPSAFPPVRRDLAFVVKTATTHETVQRTMKKFPKKKNMRDVHLFDVYQGEHVPEGHKSMAFSLTFQSGERTLTDADVEGELSGLMTWLTENVGAKQR